MEQLIESSQTRAIGLLIHHYSEHYLENCKNLKEGLAQMMEEIGEKGFDILLPYKAGNLAMPRIFEVAAAVNRMRSLKIK